MLFFNISSLQQNSSYTENSQRDVMECLQFMSIKMLPYASKMRVVIQATDTKFLRSDKGCIRFDSFRSDDVRMLLIIFAVYRRIQANMKKWSNIFTWRIKKGFRKRHLSTFRKPEDVLGGLGRKSNNGIRRKSKTLNLDSEEEEKEEGDYKI